MRTRRMAQTVWPSHLSAPTRIDASMVQASMALMYPNASAFLTQRVEPQRVGNRGYTGSPTADTYRCKDGWLATAANTPHQFRKMMGVLGLERLCEDGKALDLAAFNAPGGGFVVAKDLAYLRQQFNSAFAEHSSADMEHRLNEVGVPAARVRRLGEFLDEVDGTAKLTMPMRAYRQGQRNVRTPGLGFAVAGDQDMTLAGAPALRESTERLMRETRVGI